MPLMRRHFDPAQPMHYPHPASSLPFPEVADWPELRFFSAQLDGQFHESGATGSSQAMECSVLQLGGNAEVVLDCPLAEMDRIEKDRSAREVMECPLVKVEQSIEEGIQQPDKGNETGKFHHSHFPKSINFSVRQSNVPC
jgi:hypothetical protein